jgi:hypothetical protein
VVAGSRPLRKFWAADEGSARTESVVAGVVSVGFSGLIALWSAMLSYRVSRGDTRH